jgi:hypothetical protein
MHLCKKNTNNKGNKQRRALSDHFQVDRACHKQHWQLLCPMLEATLLMHKKLTPMQLISYCSTAHMLKHVPVLCNPTSCSSSLVFEFIWLLVPTLFQSCIHQHAYSSEDFLQGTHTIAKHHHAKERMQHADHSRCCHRSCSTGCTAVATGTAPMYLAGLEGENQLVPQQHADA